MMWGRRFLACPTYYYRECDLADEKLNVDVFPGGAGENKGINLAFGGGSLESLIETHQRGGIEHINLAAQESGFSAFGGEDLNDKIRGLGSAKYPVRVGFKDHLLALDPFGQHVRAIG